MALDESPTRRSKQMMQKLQRAIMGVAAIGAIAVGSAVVANAASNGGSTTTAANTTGANSGATGQRGAQGQPPQRNQTPITGDTADKVAAAAKDKVSGGTVLRVEGNGDGTYHAHVRKSDGSEVVVQVNKDFEATDVQEFGRGGPGGPETEVRARVRSRSRATPPTR
jgi:hypothetical protein